MNYLINLGAWNSVFAVPCAVVDQHIKLAGSAQLKVLLWLLRHAGDSCDPEEMSVALGLAKMDICDAMQYWVEAGLILQKEEGFVPVQAQPSSATAAIPAPCDETIQKAETGSALKASEKKKILPRPHSLDPAEITRRLSDADEIRAMMDMVETIFGRPLSTPEIGRVIDLHDWYGLPADVIIMMVQYAVGLGKCNMNYIEKMASDWAENDITTHERAEERIAELDRRQQAWREISSLFGIQKRQPSDSEVQSVCRWLYEWKFSREMLKEAYNRCVDSTGSVRFSYINRILERWHKENICTLEQASKEDSRSAKGKKNSASQERKPSYDLDAFEKMILQEEL